MVASSRAEVYSGKGMSWEGGSILGVLHIVVEKRIYSRRGSRPYNLRGSLIVVGKGVDLYPGWWRWYSLGVSHVVVERGAYSGVGGGGGVDSGSVVYSCGKEGGGGVCYEREGYMLDASQMVVE